MEHEHSYRSLVGRKAARCSCRVPRAPGLAVALLVAICASFVVSTSSGAAAGRRSSPQSRAWTNEAGIQHLHFQTAPIKVLPGQNSVQMVAIPQNEKPAVDGYIVRMRPDLQYLNGKVPPVNVIHLHHGVWIDGKRGPFFFGGEEKTVFHIPRGYAIRTRRAIAGRSTR
jgi:hypothetical protein